METERIAKNQPDEKRSIGGNSSKSSSLTFTDNRPKTLQLSKLIQKVNQAAQFVGILQLKELNKLLNGIVQGTSRTVSYTRFDPEAQTPLTQTSYQSTSSSFHANEEGKYPEYDWADRDWSPYGEFSVPSNAPWNRIIFDCITDRMWISKHYEDPIEITDLPDEVITYHKDIMAELVDSMTIGFKKYEDLAEKPATVGAKIEWLSKNWE